MTETATTPVITAACPDCGDGWQRTGRGQEEVLAALGEIQDHEEASGHSVTWTLDDEDPATGIAPPSAAAMALPVAASEAGT